MLNSPCQYRGWLLGQNQCLEQTNDSIEAWQGVMSKVFEDLSVQISDACALELVVPQDG